VLDIVARSVLEDDAVDALVVEQLTEGQSGGAGADDADLRPDLLAQPQTSAAVSTTSRSFAI
jgi:hypothetical protein